MEHRPESSLDPTAANNTAATSETIRRLEEIQQQLAAAWVNGERATIERLIGADWQVTHVAGQRLTRAEALHDVFETGTNKLESLVIDDVQVRLFGDVAVVTGRTNARGSYGGQPYAVLLRFTDVFVRRGSDWQAVASHASPLTP